MALCDPGTAANGPCATSLMSDRITTDFVEEQRKRQARVGVRAVHREVALVLGEDAMDVGAVQFTEARAVDDR